MRIQQLIVGGMNVCCYIVSCEKTGEAVVIDPGGDAEAILAALKEGDLKLKHIVNTHCHPDHTGANRALQEATGARTVMHEADVAYIGKPERAEFFSSLMGKSDLPPVDMPVKDGDVISFGEEKLEVLHTPGHTPGGICLYGGGNCFTGDTIFVEGTGRTDFPECSEERLVESIKTKIFTLPKKETTVWPGHPDSGKKALLKKVMSYNIL